MEEYKVYPESERNWAMLCHLSAFAGYLVPLMGIVLPLILWLSRRDQSEWIDRNGKSSLNFQLSIALYSILCIPLVILLVGIVFLVILFFLELICVIIASVNASQGKEFTYPLSIPFIQ